MKFEDMKKRVPSLKKCEAKYKELTSLIKNSKTKEEAIRVLKAYFKFEDNLESDVVVISVRNSIDTSDKVYAKAMEKISEISPIINGYSQEFLKEVMKSKFLNDLKEEFGELYFKMIENSFKTYDEKIVPLLVKENKLVLEYEKIMSSAKLPYKGEIYSISELSKYLTDKDRSVREETAKLIYSYYEENDSRIGEIYDELVHTRDEMAKQLGFKNFVELGYLRLGRIDYDENMVSKYREQIHEVVTPQVKKLRKRQAERLNIKKPDFLDYNLSFLSGNPKHLGDTSFLVNKAQEMYHDLGKESGEFFDFMVNNNLMDLDAKKNKRGGGYMTYIPKYKSPFIFANSNGTSQDVDTLTHEVGHAFQAYLGKNIKVPAYRMPTLEACEIDSMSMEFFAHPYMENFFGKDANKYRFEHLDGAISFLPYGVEVDEFQHWVYHNVDATHEERCKKWVELDKKYRPWMNYDFIPYLKKGTIWVRQSHIFSTPFYYIDYTLAQVLALEFKNEMEKNREKAWKKYIKLLKMGGKYPFVTLILKAHLKNPFISGTVKKIIKPQIKVLNETDDLKF